jgi:glucose-6-phosphate isomerase, archaeal
MEFQMDWSSGALRGDGVRTTIKTLADLSGLFRDATIALDRATIVYRVESWLPVSEGTTRGLFWGVTTLLPGKVGDEYFMTHGHFHDTRGWKA